MSQTIIKLLYDYIFKAYVFLCFDQSPTIYFRWIIYPKKHTIIADEIFSCSSSFPSQ